jgi:hypothetical protein
LLKIYGGEGLVPANQSAIYVLVIAGESRVEGGPLPQPHGGRDIGEANKVEVGGVHPSHDDGFWYLTARVEVLAAEIKK